MCGNTQIECQYKKKYYPGTNKPNSITKKHFDDGREKENKKKICTKMSERPNVTNRSDENSQGL